MVLIVVMVIMNGMSKEFEKKFFVMNYFLMFYIISFYGISEEVV